MLLLKHVEPQYISRHERIIGGPEKPLSDLGRQGFMKFWSAEIARYILGLNMFQKKHITVDDISTATWILKEDCLDALMWMDVVVDSKERNGKRTLTVDKEAVRQWSEKTKTSLVPVIDQSGFCNVFTCRDPPEEPVDEEMGE